MKFALKYFDFHQFSSIFGIISKTNEFRSEGISGYNKLFASVFGNIEYENVLIRFYREKTISAI